MKAIILIVLILTSKAEAYLLVEDVPNLTNNIVAEIKNYASMIRQELNQATQIANQVTQITNQVTQLERFGNPDYYVHLLGLDVFFNSVANLEIGIGQDISGFRQLADGAAALQYTGDGIFADLRSRVDRFGNPVMFNTGNFRKFQAVNAMTDAYIDQQKTFNQQMAALQADMKATMQLLDGDHTQMGTAKYEAKLNTLSAQMNALSQTTALAGQRAQIQQLSNQNDAARMQEATSEQQIQERQEDLQNMAANFAALVGGKQ